MTDDDIDFLARLCYRTWAENKNVPPWEDLPDFRRHTWRRIARRLWAVMEGMVRAA